MTVPDDDPDRIPTQAELDAMDLAEMTRSSGESDIRYPLPDDEPGAAPAALARDAWVCWWISAAAGIASAVYLLLNIGSLSDALQGRLRADMEQAIAEAASRVDKVSNPPKMPPDEFHGLAHFLPPVMLVALVFLLVVQFLLLRAVSVHHSRNSRNFFLATVLITLVCIPTGMDLLDFANAAPTMVIIGWIQFGALLLSGLCTLRPVVNRWLPTGRSLLPSKMVRQGSV